MMDKLVITRWRDKVLTAVFSGRKPLALTLEPEQGGSLLNNIYIGKVQKVVKNISAAFVEIGGGRVGYLPLEGTCPRVLNRPGAKKLAPGDELIIQVEKDAVKTKAPVVTCRLSFAGRYCVLTAGKPGVNFSSRLTDQSFKRRVRPVLEEAVRARGHEACGLIVRTNAGEAGEEQLLAELAVLFDQYESVQNQGNHRVCYSCLYRSLPGYMASVRDSLGGSLEAVLTDQADVYEELKHYLALNQQKDLEKLSFYDDPLLSLGALYGLDKVMEEALGKRVWLKSGGYLVIEPTEAMVVIDVNTGKYSGKKTLQETILKINLEAAVEIAHQIRLRNLSGIILVDFIDMEPGENREILLKALSEAVSADPVKTAVVDMTKLNLVEMTRKKVRRPLHEQVIPGTEE